jgi:hypothetical protein
VYLQANMPDLGPITSIRSKIEDRLRNLAIRKDIDTGSYFSLSELLNMLCDISVLSPTEYRAIRYIVEICDKASCGSKVDPYKITEATAIGERVVRIIDNRLEMA